MARKDKEIEFPDYDYKAVVKGLLRSGQGHGLLKVENENNRNNKS